MDRRRVGIVIPAFNEARTIGEVVVGAGKYGVPIVVDDGSTDECGELARRAGAIVVRHESSRGYDGALNSGFARSVELDLQYVVTMDADGQHAPEILEGIIRRLDEGADVVIGIRDKYPRLAEHVFAWVGSYAWGIKDPLCGMKGYRENVYSACGHFDSYGSIGTELAIYAATANNRIDQFEIKVRERMDKPRFGNSVKANLKIFRALLKGLRKYPFV